MILTDTRPERRQGFTCRCLLARRSRDLGDGRGVAALGRQQLWCPAEPTAPSEDDLELLPLARGEGVTRRRRRPVRRRGGQESGLPMAISSWIVLIHATQLHEWSSGGAAESQRCGLILRVSPAPLPRVTHSAPPRTARAGGAGMNPMGRGMPSTGASARPRGIVAARW